MESPGGFTKLNYAVYLPWRANASKTPVGYRLDFAVVKDAKLRYRGSAPLIFPPR